MNPLNIVAIGLSGIGVTALVTGHDGVLVTAIISALMIVAGYTMGKTVAQGTASAS